MSERLSRRAFAAGAVAATLSGGTRSPAAVTASSSQPLLDYVQSQNTTGFLIIRNRKTLVEEHWPAAKGDAAFKTVAYETTLDGSLLEDVASQQKSFVSMLVTIAIDKDLLDAAKPIAAYVGTGWSKAASDQEARVRLIDVLTMSSGLKPDFTYADAPGSMFLYNTPVYAVMKQVLISATGRSLEAVTRDWLTGPAGMSDTSWRKRPAAFADVGNPTGLVTSPRDTAIFGQIILDGGRAANGKRIVSKAGLRDMFARSATNPSYGRLWWLNGGAYAVKPLATRVEGPLIPAAPADLVAALGAFDRKLYVIPSEG